MARSFRTVALLVAAAATVWVVSLASPSRPSSVVAPVPPVPPVAPPAALEQENSALRREIEALRQQPDALQWENSALRREIEALKQQPAPPPPPPPPPPSPSPEPDRRAQLELETLRAAHEALQTRYQALSTAPPPPPPATTPTTTTPTTTQAQAQQEAQQEALAQFTRRQQSADKFVVWKIQEMGGAGMGNRVLGMVSALALAMVTDRAFLVEDDVVLEHFDVNPALDARVSRASGQAMLLSLGLGTNHVLGCDDVTAIAQPVIFVESTQYFMPLLSHNPHVGARLTALLGTRRFHALFSFLLRPKPALAAEADRWAAQHFAGKHVVALQVRDQHLIRHDAEQKDFARCARMLGETYFLATDSDAVRAKMKGLLPGIMSYSPPASLKKHWAVLDLLLLARADERIITWPKSTFGSLAAGMAGDAPYAVTSGKDHRGTCTRLLTPDPCFHGWYMRRRLTCYDEARFESPETLNQNNCYFCHSMTQGKCPDVEERGHIVEKAQRGTVCEEKAWAGQRVQKCS